MKRSKQWEKLYKMGQNAAANKEGYNLWKGAAHFLGWCNVVGTCRADEFTGDEWYMSLDGQDIQETLQNAALNTRQFPHWTPFENWQDITALMVKMGEGEYLELWGTSSSTPYLNSTIYHPLPVSLQGGESYHVYRLLRAKGEKTI